MTTNKLSTLIKNFMLFILCSFLCFNSKCYQTTVSRNLIISNLTYTTEVNNVIDAWNSSVYLNQFNIENNCNINELYYSFLPDEEFVLRSDGYCPITSPDAPKHECNQRFGYAYAFYSRDEQVLYLTSNILNKKFNEQFVYYLIRHETVHWLSTCTRHEESSYLFDNSDSSHLDGRLWFGTYSVLEQSSLTTNLMIY